MQARSVSLITCILNVLLAKSAIQLNQLKHSHRIHHEQLESLNKVMHHKQLPGKRSHHQKSGAGQKDLVQNLQFPHEGNIANGKRSKRQWERERERLGLVQEPELMHERSLSTWERDLVNDDDDELIREEMVKDAPSMSHQSEVTQQRQGVPLATARFRTGQQRKRLQALFEQKSGAEMAVVGAQRAKARAINRVRSLQQQVKDLNVSFSAASADVKRLLLESKVEENQTAAAFMHAEHLALSLQESKRKYHLADAAAKTFAVDLGERQNDQTEAMRLVDQIQREVDDLTTHARHVQSELDNATKAPLDAPAETNSAPSTESEVASLPQLSRMRNNQQSLDRLVNHAQALHPSAFPTTSVTAGKASSPHQNVEKARLPSPVTSTSGQRSRISVGLSNLQSFGKLTHSGNIPVLPKPRFSDGEPVGHNTVGRAPKAEVARKASAVQSKKPVVNEEGYRGDSIQLAFSSTLLSIQGTLAQSAWFAWNALNGA